MDLPAGNDDAVVPQDGTGEPVRYVYRPSPMGGGFTFELTGAGLSYELGRRKGVVPYAAIRRVRLSYKPGSMQPRRYVTEIWADDFPRLTVASSSWSGLMIQERQDKPYATFVAALHRRLAAGRTQIAYERGAPAILYWPGVVCFIVVALSMAALIVRGLQSATYSGAAFVALFLGLFVWHGGNFFRRNKPGRYDADALPPDLLP